MSVSCFRRMDNDGVRSPLLRNWAKFFEVLRCVNHGSSGVAGRRSRLSDHTT
jgi:hypothetical protein